MEVFLIKERIDFRVSEEDYIFLQQLKLECVKKNSSYYGHWGRKICDLARLGLEHEVTRTHTHKLPVRKENSYQKLLFSMQEYYNIADLELVDIIDFNCGRGAKDKRTFNTYKQNLLKDDIISLDPNCYNKRGREVYIVNKKKLLFKLRKLSGTIEDYNIKSTTRQPIKTEVERPIKQKHSHKAEIDKILAEAGVVKT